MRENLSKVHEIEKDFCVLLLSLPTRGGWIEIRSSTAAGPSASGSPSPHGEGGLKYGLFSFRGLRLGSLSTRGGWIEMEQKRNMCRSTDVPPLAGRVD